MTINISRPPATIKIGYDGENNWRPQTFDCSTLTAKHPDGILTLWVMPNGAAQAFPVAVTRNGDNITWTPLDSELVEGTGKLQIHCQDGGDVGKNDIMDFEVCESLVGGGEHPAETPSWAARVVEAAEHYPKIVNGNWHVWDVQNAEWADTGVSAGGDVPPEQIAEAIEAYFDEHPITVDSELSGESENPVQNKVVKAALDARADKTPLLNLLIPILRQGIYGTDQEAAISALETVLGGTPSVQTYIITNNLTNVTNSNDATAVNAGTSYTAMLTPDEGMEMQTVTITMGGTNVSQYYSNGTITIPSVTGAVVITATAVESAPLYTNLVDTTASDYMTNKRYNSSGALVDANGVDITNKIPFTLGNCKVRTNIDITSNAPGSIADYNRVYLFDANGNYSNYSYTNNTDAGVSAFTDEGNGITRIDFDALAEHYQARFANAVSFAIGGIHRTKPVVTINEPIE